MKHRVNLCGLQKLALTALAVATLSGALTAALSSLLLQ